MSAQDRVTPRVLSHRRHAEPISLQSVVTSRQQHLDWDAQSVASTACVASVCKRQGPLRERDRRAGLHSPQAGVRPAVQLLGTNPGSPSCRIVFLCVGLVFSVAVSWQGLLVCLMNMEMGVEEAAREVLQIGSE